jgi:very-short-patch-repair endonuclease
MLRRPGMPAFSRQKPLPWAPQRRADVMLVGSPVIVEADGRSWHTRVADFATDRRRDNVATRHGFDTLRYTYAELMTDPGGVSAEIAAVHGRYQPSSFR